MSGSPAPLPAGLIELADQCVKCGLCLPHCPTYALSALEAEGPRGRIALARALADGTLEPGPSLQQHLDQCLGCRACEVVCPSGVRYGELLDGTRALQAAAGAAPASTLPRGLLRHPDWLTRLLVVAARLRASRWLPVVTRVLPRHTALRRLAAALPHPPAAGNPRTAKPAHAGKRVALFRGCVAHVHDADTLAAAGHLLQAAGHTVLEVRGGQCCGALPRHHGEWAAAERVADAAAASLDRLRPEAVLVAASGCQEALLDAAVRSGMPAPVVDIHRFLATDPGFARLRFRPCRENVALHLPCTHQQQPGAVQDILALLTRLPGLALEMLPPHPRCCGGAGTYFMDHPAPAAALRDAKLAQAHALGPARLLTTNVGCRLHLAAGTPMPVLHPLALLAAHLDNERHGTSKPQPA